MIFGLSPGDLLQLSLAIGVAVNIWLTLRIANMELRVKLWAREQFVEKRDCEKYRSIGHSRQQSTR